MLLRVELPQTTMVVFGIPFLQGIATKYLPDVLGISLPLIAVALYVLGVLLNRLSRQRRGLPQPSLLEYQGEPPGPCGRPDDRGGLAL